MLLTKGSFHGGTMATKTLLITLAPYHRNDWHNMTEMAGTTATELSTIPTGRVIHQRIVDDDHCISSGSSRIYDGPDPFPGRTPSASCRCFSIPRSTKTLIAEWSCRLNFP